MLLSINKWNHSDNLICTRAGWLAGRAWAAEKVNGSGPSRQKSYVKHYFEKLVKFFWGLRPWIHNLYIYTEFKIIIQRELKTVQISTKKLIKFLLIFKIKKIYY